MHRAEKKGFRVAPPGYKRKDLVGVPWMLAKALQADGWTLRRDVIWNKMAATEPARVDRPAGSHEFIFLLSQTRFYDFDATPLPHGTVWSFVPSGYPGHPAAFPPAIVKPCILAGSKPGDLVLDPFAGSATVGEVAVNHDRRFLGIELNPTFAELGRSRIRDAAPMFNPQLEISA